MQWVNLNGNNSTLLYFDCLSSIANVQVSSVNKEEWGNYIHRAETRPIDWYGVEGAAKLRETVELYGWDSGVSKGFESLKSIKAPKLPSIKRKKVYSNLGHMYNPIRAYSGSIDKAWSSTKRELSANKFNKRGLVNIIIDSTASAGVKADNYFWRGALAVVIAKELQKSGRKVRILNCFSISNHVSGDYRKEVGTKNLTIAVEIKNYTQPLEYNSMFASCGLSGFFRWYGFKALLSLPYRIKGSYGRPDALEVGNVAPLIDNNPTIIIENIWSESAAKRRATSIIEDLSV